MVVLDLRWTLFGLLALVTLAVVVALWLDRRRRRGREILESLLAALEAAPVGLLVLDGQGTGQYANRQARSLLGLANPAVPLPDERWAQQLREDQVATHGARPAAGRYRSVAVSDRCVVRWWVTPYDAQDLVVLLDVTQQQYTEQAARFLLNDLAHELRTPLATILTHIDVLRLPDLADEIGQRSLLHLRNEAQRMARLIHDMLELGRLETSVDIEHRPVELFALVEETLAGLTPQADAGQIALTLDATTPLPWVVGDEDQLRQVFTNVLDNALKYAQAGGRVAVSLQPEADTVRCAVCDTGPGIPAQHLPQLARRFYRAGRPMTDGSGLGLALVAEILRRHGSALEVESHTDGPARGTCVRFTLPALKETS